MDATERTYHFHYGDRCNMCGSPIGDAQVLGMRLNQSQGVNPRSKTGIAVSVCRCSGCGMHFPHPLPTPHRLSDHYSMPPRAYWENEDYFKLDPQYFGRQIADARRLLGDREGLRSLDIGLGIGKAAVAMRNAGFDVWGIEPSKTFFDKAREVTGLPDDRVQNLHLEEATFPPNFFDFISFGAVLEHLYDPAASIESALGWLAPSGAIQIEVPSSDHLLPQFLNLFFMARGTNFVTNLSPMHPPYHLYEFRPQSFERHGDAVGYELAHRYYDVASIRHFPRALHPFLRTWMEKRNSGMQLTVWLRKTAQA